MIVLYNFYKGGNSLDYVILKNKYFAIKIDNNILLFDIEIGNLLKRFDLYLMEIQVKVINTLKNGKMKKIINSYFS